MKACYISVHHIVGISALPGGATSVSLGSRPQPRAEAVLTTDPEVYCLHLDRSVALATGILSGLFGDRRPGTPQERFVVLVEETANRRRRQHSNGTFLVVTGSDEILSPNLSLKRDLDEISVCIDGFRNDELIATFAPFVTHALAAVGLALPPGAHGSIARVGATSYLVPEDDQKPIYNLNPSVGSPTVYVSTVFADSEIEFARTRLRGRPLEGALAKVSDLLVESHQLEATDVRAFITAWSSLEIFVNTTFNSHYEKRWFIILSNAIPGPTQTVTARLKTVMSDKYRLNDKFLIIATILDDDHAEIDGEIFADIKKTRDNLFHGQVTSRINYPVRETQKLVQRYLNLHLTSQRSPRSAASAAGN